MSNQQQEQQDPDKASGEQDPITEPEIEQDAEIVDSEAIAEPRSTYSDVSLACPSCGKIFMRETEDMAFKSVRGHWMGRKDEDHVGVLTREMMGLDPEEPSPSISRTKVSKKPKASGAIPSHKLQVDESDPIAKDLSQRTYIAELEARLEKAESVKYRYRNEIQERYNPDYGQPPASRRQQEMGPLSDIEMSRYLRSQRERDEQDVKTISSSSEDGTSKLIDSLMNEVKSLKKNLDVERQKRLEDKITGLESKIDGLRHQGSDARTAAVHELGDVFKSYFGMLQGAMGFGSAPLQERNKIESQNGDPSIYDLLPQEFLED